MSRFYSALLHLYPASFRAEYGGEMRSILGARLRETSGTLSRLKLWVETIADVVFNAAAVHWDILRQDLRYTARTLARSPGFALTAVLVTALGIGANTAAFSVADFVLLRALPYPDADRLVKLWEAQDGGRNQVSPAIYRQWKTSQSFESMGAYYTNAVNLVGQGDPWRLETAVVTADLLPILGIQPMLGRLFIASEEGEGATGPVVLSYGVWQAQLGGDPAIVGRQILIDGNPRIVVGVMPRDFHFPNRDIALWTLIGTAGQNDEDISNTYWEVLAKLRRGVPHKQASTEMDLIARRLQQQYPDDMENVGVLVNPLRDELSNQSRLLLLALCGAAVCVLLIACANLANLLLARALMRRKEILVRTALGAGRERLVRQSMTESLVLAALGGALGVAVAYVALPLLTRLVPTTLPIAQLPSIDPRVLVFAALLTAVTGVGFGVLPAWRSAGRVDIAGMGLGARSGGGRRERARSALVIAEVMASVVLLISAGLLMRALLRLQSVDPGFKAESVLTLRTALTGVRNDTTGRRIPFYRDVLSGVRAIPGVSSAAYITSLPIANMGGVWPVIPEGQALTGARADRASSRFVSPGYFTTLGIPLRRGRDVSDSDDANQVWIAVVSESFVKRYYPNEDPIGKRFKFLGTLRTVVGVVGDVRMRGPEQQSEPQVYLSYKQVADAANTFYSPKDLVIRSSVPAATLIPALRRVVQQVDPQQPISNIKTLSAIVSDVTAARAVQVRVLVAFAAIAFLLAAIGIHGLLSFTVSSRQHEIGVRMALGAQRSEIVRLIMRQGIFLAAAGVLPGLAIAYAAGRGMQTLLAGVQPADAVTFLAAGLLCIAMTLVGSLVPTLRAARVDPATAFRSDA
ncbi:MAG: putative transport system permease protein [Chloroflexota bacterium]|jgi:putative ABC transport system permease protein|nr:putative transport system permease protein [Chloroflexota bacterium]